MNPDDDILDELLDTRGYDHVAGVSGSTAWAASIEIAELRERLRQCLASPAPKPD